MRLWICVWTARQPWQLLRLSIIIAIRIWYESFLNTVKISFLSRLLARLSRLEVSSPLKQRQNWLKLSSQPSQLRSWRRKAIQPSRFFRPFGLRSMMNWAQRMSLFSRPLICWRWTAGLRSLLFIRWKTVWPSSFSRRLRQWMFLRACPSSLMNCSLSWSWSAANQFYQAKKN